MRLCAGFCSAAVFRPRTTGVVPGAQIVNPRSHRRSTRYRRLWQLQRLQHLVHLDACGEHQHCRERGIDTDCAYLASFATPSTLGSTVPSNGDVNPYGLVLVPSNVGKLHAGELLVSNFNDSANDQGTGTTIDQITRLARARCSRPSARSSLPGSCPGGVGLTTALNTLPGGYVVVGSLPTTNGKSATAKYGCLIVLDSATATSSKRSPAPTSRARGTPLRSAKGPRRRCSSATR